MDKHLAKTVLKQAGLDVLDHRRIERGEWEADRGAVLSSVEGEIPLPAVVKPATLGSSIGVARCERPSRSRRRWSWRSSWTARRSSSRSRPARSSSTAPCSAVPAASCASPRSSARSARGAASRSRTSTCRPAARAGAKGAAARAARRGRRRPAAGMAAAGPRCIPADVDPELRERGPGAEAEKAHRALRVAGVVRYDFFVIDDGARIVVNEPNTVPGSFAFYLFEPVGLPFPDLLDGCSRSASPRPARSARPRAASPRAPDPATHRRPEPGRGSRLWRAVAGTRGQPPLRPPGREGAAAARAEVELVDVDATFVDVVDCAAGLRLHRAARGRRRGRHGPGPAGDPAGPVHRLRRARLRDLPRQAHVQGRLRAGAACRRRRGTRSRSRRSPTTARQDARRVCGSSTGGWSSSPPVRARRSGVASCTTRRAGRRGARRDELRRPRPARALRARAASWP